MKNYKIDADIPLPTNEGLVTVMKRLNIGDSFLLDSKEARCVYSVATYVGIKVSVRKENDQTRVWRVN